MTLSEHEQHLLDEIEACTRSADPGFAANLDLVAALNLRARRMALARFGFWLGFVTVLVGAGVARGPISVGGFVAGCGSVLMVWAAVTALRNRIPVVGSRSGKDPNNSN